MLTELRATTGAHDALQCERGELEAELLSLAAERERDRSEASGQALLLEELRATGPPGSTGSDGPETGWQQAELHTEVVDLAAVRDLLESRLAEEASVAEDKAYESQVLREQLTEMVGEARQQSRPAEAGFDAMRAFPDFTMPPACCTYLPQIFEDAASNNVAALQAALAADPQQLQSMLHIKDEEGRSLLHLAIASGADEVAGFIVSEMTNWVNRCRCAYNAQGEAMQKRFSQMFNAQDRAGRSPLALLARIEDPAAEVAAALLEARADPAQRDGDGVTPFIESARSGNIALGRSLLELTQGSVVLDTDDSRRSALHWASSEGRGNFVELLILSRAAPDVMDLDGRTPVDLARSAGQTDIVKILQTGGDNRGEGSGADLPRGARDAPDPEYGGTLGQQTAGFNREKTHEAPYSNLRGDAAVESHPFRYDSTQAGYAQDTLWDGSAGAGTRDYHPSDGIERSSGSVQGPNDEALKSFADSRYGDVRDDLSKDDLGYIPEMTYGEARTIHDVNSSNDGNYDVGSLARRHPAGDAQRSSGPPQDSQQDEELEVDEWDGDVIQARPPSQGVHQSSAPMQARPNIVREAAQSSSDDDVPVVRPSRAAEQPSSAFSAQCQDLHEPVADVSSDDGITPFCLSQGITRSFAAPQARRDDSPEGLHDFSSDDGMQNHRPAQCIKRSSASPSTPSQVPRDDDVREAGGTTSGRVCPSSGSSTSDTADSLDIIELPDGTGNM